MVFVRHLKGRQLNPSGMPIYRSSSSSNHNNNNVNSSTTTTTTTVTVDSDAFSSSSTLYSSYSTPPPPPPHLPTEMNYDGSEHNEDSSLSKEDDTNDKTDTNINTNAKDGGRKSALESSLCFAPPRSITVSKSPHKTHPNATMVLLQMVDGAIGGSSSGDSGSWIADEEDDNGGGQQSTTAAGDGGGDRCGDDFSGDAYDGGGKGSVTNEEALLVPLSDLFLEEDDE